MMKSNQTETSGKPRLSILLLGTQMAVGGAQKVLLDQARWFHEHGFKVTAVFFYDKEGAYEKWQALSAFPILDLKAHKLGLGLFGNSILLIRGLWAYWKLLRSNHFDVIETVTHDSNMLGLPLAWMAGVRVRIATHHGFIDGFPRWRERVHAWMVNHNFAQKLVVVSNMIRKEAIEEGVDPQRIVVIQNGIRSISLEGINRSEVRQEADVRENEVLLLSVGRLVYQKAHEILVKAMPAVLKEFPNTKLDICGDGYMRPKLEAQINSLGLSKNIRLLGRRDDVEKFLAAADILVLPSRWEGLPIALLEAMSVSLPVVATNVQGVDEVIVEGEHGLLVSVEDADKLAAAILQLLHDPLLRKKMGRAGQKRLMDTYSIDRMAERYLSLILSEIDRKN